MDSLEKIRPMHLKNCFLATLLLGGVSWELLHSTAGWADVAVNTGIAQGTIIGNGNMQAGDTGIGINGSTLTDTSLNNNQNSLSNDNKNVNYLQPIMLSAPQSGGGNGGSSALVLPRNPLTLPNAALGRSNFGLQFGVQNNPGVVSASGAGSALGWFMQGGVSIPFGRIPDVYKNPQANRLDEARLGNMENQRNVFGNAKPQAGSQVDAKVQGKVLGLNAYNYSAVESGKMNMPDRLKPAAPIGEIVIPQPHVLALEPADVFTQPIHTGEKIGLIEVGKEYPYLGHTRSGWVKVLLSNGTEGWTTTRFEYIKHDYTEIDTLAVDTTGVSQKKIATKLQPRGKGGS
jgi:hypothetical protein